MGGTSGIYLFDMEGGDSHSADWGRAGETTSDLGIYTYQIDVQDGETFTLSGNWGAYFEANRDSDASDYTLINPPSFGSFTLVNATGGAFERFGEFEFSFTAQDLLDNGGWNQTIEFQVSGYGDTDRSGFRAHDTDTIQIVVTCFAEGTLIATPDGERAVETLRIGDPILSGEGDAIPVKWVGRQTLVKAFAGARAQLVRIKADTLDNHSDLYVTGDHGMLVGGYIVNASALVNGSTIHWVPLPQTPERHTVYHVETELHDIIIANGAFTETYLDIPGRGTFDNFDEYLSLYHDEPMICEMDRIRISSSRLLPQTLRKELSVDEDSTSLSQFGPRPPDASA